MAPSFGSFGDLPMMSNVDKGATAKFLVNSSFKYCYFPDKSFMLGNMLLSPYLSIMRLITSIEIEANINSSNIWVDF